TRPVLPARSRRTSDAPPPRPHGDTTGRTPHPGSYPHPTNEFAVTPLDEVTDLVEGEPHSPARQWTSTREHSRPGGIRPMRLFGRLATVRRTPCSCGWMGAIPTSFRTRSMRPC